MELLNPKICEEICNDFILTKFYYDLDFIDQEVMKLNDIMKKVMNILGIGDVKRLSIEKWYEDCIKVQTNPISNAIFHEKAYILKKSSQSYRIIIRTVVRLNIETNEVIEKHREVNIYRD